ncbi:MAG: porin [Neptuniibacter sp.]
MKKITLALAISAAVLSQASNAATIYDDKGLTFKMKGDWQIQLRDNADDTKDLEVEFDDLEIKNTVSYDLGNGLQAFGQLDFSFNSAAEGGTDGSKLEEAYLGLRNGGVAARVGKMNTAGDEFGVEAAYEKPAGVGEDQFERVKDAGDDVIRVDAEFANVTLSASHEVEANDGDQEATDLFINADFDAVSVAAAFQTVDDTAESWGLSAEFDAGFAKIGADYSVSDIEGQDEDDTTTNLVAKFKATDTTSVAIGFVNYDKNNTDTDAWYANVSYKFPAQKNVKLFAEISDSDAGDETDVLAGMQIKF